MKRILEQAKHLYALEGCTFIPVSGHEGGRNQNYNEFMWGTRYAKIITVEQAIQLLQGNAVNIT